MFGGRSSEHASRASTAGSVLQAIDPDSYDVVPVGITHDGRWVLESADPERLAITAPDKLPEVDGSRCDGGAGPRRTAAASLVVHEPGAVPRTLGEVDVVFPLLHGPWGEDGTMQGLLRDGRRPLRRLRRAGLRRRHGQALHEGGAGRRTACRCCPTP